MVARSASERESSRDPACLSLAACSSSMVKRRRRRSSASGAGFETTLITQNSYPFNGATAFRRWKRDSATIDPNETTYLQWGHRLSAMETRKAHPGYFHLEVPSMGPPPFGDGNWAHPHPAPEGRYLPSMGPPPFGDGNRCNCGATYCPSRTFNGATAFRRWKLPPTSNWRRSGLILQWGHRLSAMETDEEVWRRWKPINLQWGHRLSAMETGPGAGCHSVLHRSFNGATAFRRWKH